MSTGGHWILVRKPLEGSVAENVLKHGTGALNIDGCRIGAEGGGTKCSNRDPDGKCLGHPDRKGEAFGMTYHGSDSDGGRWPANTVLSHLPGCRRTGTREVEGTGGGWNGLGSDEAREVYNKGWAPDGVNRQTPGKETVETWECEPECPVRQLDKQSVGMGMHSAGGKAEMTVREKGDGRTCYSKMPEDRYLFRLGDEGGASRFFKTFGPDEDEPLGEASGDGMGDHVVHFGDCIEVMQEKIEENSIDALCCDPPAGIAFMGKAWDAHSSYKPRTPLSRRLTMMKRMKLLERWELGFLMFTVDWASSALRLLKPGAHGLVWALPRTADLTQMGLRMAGFELRDVVVHLQGQGFPKGHNVSKAIDKKFGAERTVVWDPDGTGEERVVQKTMATTEEAQKWEGFGTALKPAAEHWVLVRKAPDGSIVENVLEHGTGALNMEAWKCAEGCPVAELDEQSGISKAPPTRPRSPDKGGNTTWNLKRDGGVPHGHDDEGGASRFFYTKKAPTNEKFFYCHDCGKAGPMARFKPHKGHKTERHPTQKSIKLMRWMVRLVAPPGGTVLDPFTGSGTTGVAVVQEGMVFVGAERDSAHHAVARYRVIRARPDVRVPLRRQDLGVKDGGEGDG